MDIYALCFLISVWFCIVCVWKRGLVLFVSFKHGSCLLARLSYGVQLHKILVIIPGLSSCLIQLCQIYSLYQVFYLVYAWILKRYHLCLTEVSSGRLNSAQGRSEMLTVNSNWEVQQRMIWELWMRFLHEMQGRLPRISPPTSSNFQYCILFSDGIYDMYFYCFNLDIQTFPISK